MEEIKSAEAAGELWRLTLVTIRPHEGHAPDRCKIHNELNCNYINSLIEIGMPLDKIYQLSAGYRCEHPLMGPGAKSCPDAIARELKKHIKPEVDG